MILETLFGIGVIVLAACVMLSVVTLLMVAPAFFVVVGMLAAFVGVGAIVGGNILGSGEPSDWAIIVIFSGMGLSFFTILASGDF